ncbi:MAG: hypothetical protein K2R98_28110 [Gemmataceae bacterium]|nr:hypothetical protein [Gemmataceae bacterium]
MKITKRTLLVCLAGYLSVALLLNTPAAADDKNKDEKKPEPQPAISMAAMATQLALEGQKRKSPTLMLAAVELLGPLKEGAGKVKDVTSKTEGMAAKSDKQALKLNVTDWIDLAKEYAKNDKELSAFLEKKIEELSKRGLIYNQGKDKTSLDVKGTTYKVISSGVIAPNQVLTLSNVIFEGNKPAVIAVIGDGDGDLDLYVYRGNGTDNLIGKDTGPSSIAVISWFQGAEGPITVKVPNVGKVAERYVVLANW